MSGDDRRCNRARRCARTHFATLLAAALLVAPALLAAPAQAADEIHWTMLDYNSVAVDWRGASPIVRYGLTSSYGLTATGHAPSPLPFSSPGPFWEVRIGGLEAGRVYHYSIDGGPDHTFHGMPEPGSSFTVFVEGDVGSTLTFPRVAAVQALVAGGGPSFALVIGDLTYGNDNGLADVDQHFNDVMVWSQDAAYMPMWGNHEWPDTLDDMRNYKGRFDLPHASASTGAPAEGCCGEDWYWFDAGNVRFIAVPEPYTGALPQWQGRAQTLMDEAQAAPWIRYIVTFGHRPAYSTGYHGSLLPLRAILDSLGATHDKYVLDLSAHCHDYERTQKQFGVTHATIGIGGATLEVASTPTCPWVGGCPAPAWEAYRAFHHGTLRLEFTSSSIHGDAICGPVANHDDITCDLGSVFDSFTIGDAPPVIAGAPGNVSVTAGQKLTIGITASDPNGDPITALSAMLTGLPPGNNATFTPGAGNVSGQLTWTPATRDAGTYTIGFRAADALACTTRTIVDVERLLDGPAPAPLSLAVVDVRPNPAVSAFTLSYSLGAPGLVGLELLDVAGRSVQRLELGDPGPGLHEARWQKPAGLPAGLYWLRLTQSGRTVQRPLVLRP